MRNAPVALKAFRPNGPLAAPNVLVPGVISTVFNVESAAVAHDELCVLSLPIVGGGHNTGVRAGIWS
jgi:hypothetical protein